MNLFKLFKKEERASKHINVLSHYDDDTLLDKSGKLIKIVKLQGLNFMTRDNLTLDIFKQRRNHLLKSFSSEYALYTWEVRRKVNCNLGGEFKNKYAAGLNERYVDNLQKSPMYVNDIYLAIITKNPEGLINKLVSFVNWFNHAFDKASKQEYLAKRHKELNEVTAKVLSALSEYGAKLLSTYESNGEYYSEPLNVLSYLVNGDYFPVPLCIKEADKLLPRKRIFFNGHSGIFEQRAADGSSRYGATLSIKGYSPKTFQGMLNEVSKLPIEYVITQSLRPYDRHVAQGKLRDKQSDMLQSKDESLTQAEEINDAFENTASGDVLYGKHHFTLAVYADSLDELHKNIATLIATFSNLNIACVREDIAAQCAYWAQFPGNFSYILREADISTKNFASFASLHNYPQGKKSGNHWGDAITVLQTIGGTPYYFNFHHRDVGNFLMVGAMGSGKTLLSGFLIGQSMKCGGKRIIFDKDRGLEIAVHALGGVYEILKPGRKTGFNPCQLDDTEENRTFLAALFKKMLTVHGASFTEKDAEVVAQAIDGMYRAPKSTRQLRHLAPYFGVKIPGSLRARFDEWHTDGSFAWLFDNDVDSLDLSPDVMGFDLTNIMNAEGAKTPALMYLTHRVEQALYGNRGILFIDEGWRLLNDEFFVKLIEEWSRTPRKKNFIFGFATQVANDTLSSSVSKAINESAFCKIFFANPSADRKVYCDGFGLSEREYELIKTLSDDEHYFLLVHGTGVNRESVVAKVNLTGMKDDIAIISAREETLIIMDNVKKEYGNDPEITIPEFLEQHNKKGRCA